MLDQLMVVTFEHVKARCGDAWNEFADRLCDCGGSGEKRSFNRSTISKERARHPAHVAWAFTYVASDSTLSAYPPLDRIAGRLDGRPVSEAD